MRDFKMLVTAPVPSTVAFASLKYWSLSEVILKGPDDTVAAAADAALEVCACPRVCVHVFSPGDGRASWDAGGGKCASSPNNQSYICADVGGFWFHIYPSIYNTNGISN